MNTASTQPGIMLNQKVYAIVSFSVLGYFLLLYTINFFQFDHVLIGVFVELLTIPALLAQVVLLVVGISQLLKRKQLLLTTKICIVLLAVSAIFTLGSFFW